MSARRHAPRRHTGTGPRRWRWAGRWVLTAVITTSLLAPSVIANAAPSPPASNGELIFLRTTSGQRALYRVHADGSQREQLTPLPLDHYGNQPLDVSPDGRRLLWIAREPIPGSLERRSLLQVSNADGSSRTTIKDLGEQRDLDSASWSADGRSIAYIVDDRLEVVDADGGNERRIPAPTGELSSVHWSPTGRHIALLADDRPNAPGIGGQLWVMNADGSDRWAVSTGSPDQSDTSRPSEVRWSPDGSQLAVVEDDPFRLDCIFRAIKVVGVDGAGLRTIDIEPPFTCHVRRLVWSPDGAQLAVQAAADEENTHLWTIPVAGGPRAQLTGPRDDTNDQLATWRPVPDLMAAACPSGGVPRSGFADVTGVHRRSVDCLRWWGVAEGFGEGRFAPQESVTRAQMATSVVRTLEAAGETLPASSAPRFSDLDGSVHAQRIEQLAEAGIVQGFSDGVFAPSRPVTRAQMAAFLARAEAWRAGAELPAVPDAFLDDQAHVLQREINQVAAVGLSTGVHERTFAPGSIVTRGQMATFLARLLDRAVRDGSVTTLPGSAG
jgi:Tol biopolymer transport system component